MFESFVNNLYWFVAAWVGALFFTISLMAASDRADPPDDEV